MVFGKNSIRMKKVAIYQNNITYGGRICVISTMTECLNKMGIIPDWFSYQCSFKMDDLSKIHSIPIKAKLKKINVWSRGLGEIKYIKLNKIISKMSKEYDLIINSNNVLGRQIHLGLLGGGFPVALSQGDLASGLGRPVEPAEGFEED